ncbi:MAG TPA: S-layer homology domain-containing protein [Clostridia bacterium]
MKRKTFAILLIMSCVIISLAFPVLASSFEKLQEDYSKDLIKLNLLKGYPDGSLHLENKIKRSEYVTFAIRMAGYENIDASSVKLSFKDVTKSNWAYNNIKIALKCGLVSGYPDNTFAPEKNVTYPEALMVLIRALGYEKTLKGKWPDNVISKAKELGISKDIDLPASREITRGEMTVLVHNSLTVDIKQ